MRTKLLTPLLVAGLSLALTACSADSVDEGASPPSDSASPAADAPAADAPDAPASPADAELPVLTAADALDPARLQDLAGPLDLELSPPLEIERHRGAGSGPDLFVLYPRGTVLLEDLDKYRIDVGVEFESEGMLAFRRGKEVLYEAPFDPELMITRADIPDGVVAALDGKSGTVTWGFYPTEGKPVTGTFKLKSSDAKLAKRLKGIEKRTRGQPEIAQRQLRAQLLLNKRYAYAAYREALAAYELDGDASQAVVIMQSAARQMDLGDTPLWSELLAISDAQGERVKGRASGRGQGTRRR